MSRLAAIFATCALVLLGCTETVSRNETARILAMGDSLLATHSLTGRSIPDVLERALGEKVINRSVPAARMVYKLPITGAAGFSIPKQYRAGPWEWVVLNGGGNDLWLGCGCARCDRRMDQLISEDGTGEIPDLVRRLRATGAKVAYVGYLRSPGRGSPIEQCKDEGDELERRISAFAEQTEGMTFVSIADIVPFGDRSLHAFDMIHPSVKGSVAIGRRLAEVIAGR